MINYTPQKQLKLELFKHPFETKLDKENRWVKLAAVIPWDELASIYGRKLQQAKGRKSVNVRTVLAALIIKHILKLDDRGTIEMIKENIYLQYFCGLEGFTTKSVFDPSLFVLIRKRLGLKEFDEMNRHIIEVSEKLKPHQSRIKQKNKKDKDSGKESNNQDGKTDEENLEANKDLADSNEQSLFPDTESEVKNRGTLKVDATVADQEIKYPNDVGLLNDSRKELERMIHYLYDTGVDEKYPRLYPRKARQDYLNFAKKKKKSQKEIRKAIRKQLQYVRRDLKIIDEMLSIEMRRRYLTKRDSVLLGVIRKIYDQQKWMYEHKSHTIANRIVSLHQWWVHPIVRGKDRNKVEFGSKLNVSEVGGFCRIDHLKWDAYNEGQLLREQVENFKALYGCYPKYLLGDRIYLNRENRKYLKSKGIKIVGKPLGRPSKSAQTSNKSYREKKKAAERNHIEGKFGQGKRGYRLNNIRARLQETSESWISAIFLVMNLTKLLVIAEKYGNFFVQNLFRIFFTIIKQKFFRFDNSTITSSVNLILYSK